jgi:DNA-binding MarR family transcriptional regulator
MSIMTGILRETSAKRGGRARRWMQAIADSVEQLSPHHVQLLRALLRYPFSRAEDVAIARDSSVAAVYRHLALLHSLGLVERVIPGVLGRATGSLYHLSNLGLYVLAVYEQADPEMLARSWQTHERGLLRLLPRLAHLVTLQDCINGLVAHAPEALARQGRKPVCRWHWLRDYRHRFSFRDQDMSCTADALLILKVRRLTEYGLDAETLWYSMVLFLDPTINERSLMTQRLRCLLYYRECPERQRIYHHFPLVLILVTNPHRCEHWQRAAADALKMQGSLFAPLEGVIARLPDEHGTALTNLWRLPWSTLSGNTPCHVKELLAPMPLEAIPFGPLGEDVARDDAVDRTREKTRECAVPSGVPRFKQVIRGDFAARAALFTKGGTNGQEEQDTMALLGLVMSHRLLNLLRCCLDHPLLTMGEMAALFTVADGSMERYLRELRHMGCVVREETPAGERWRLSERGLRLVAAAHHMSVSRIATTSTPAQQGTAPSLVQLGLDEVRGHIEHTAGIYGFFASLAQAAQGRCEQGHRLLWWETGSLCERRYRDHDHWYNLRPDGAGEYQAGAQRVRFWLEWDRGTMVVRDLATKFHTYARYVAYRTWVKEHAVLPLLLTVAADPGQERRIRRIAQQQVVQISGLVMRMTTASLLARYGPLAPIWSQVVPRNDGLVVSSPMPPVMRTTFFAPSREGGNGAGQQAAFS